MVRGGTGMLREGGGRQGLGQRRHSGDLVFPCRPSFDGCWASSSSRAPPAFDTGVEVERPGPNFWLRKRPFAMSLLLWTRLTRSAIRSIWVVRRSSCSDSKARASCRRPRRSGLRSVGKTEVPLERGGEVVRRGLDEHVVSAEPVPRAPARGRRSVIVMVILLILYRISLGTGGTARRWTSRRLRRTSWRRCRRRLRRVGGSARRVRRPRRGGTRARERPPEPRHRPQLARERRAPARSR